MTNHDLGILIINRNLLIIDGENEIFIGSKKGERYKELKKAMEKIQNEQ